MLHWNELIGYLVNCKASYHINHGSYHLLARSRCTLKHSCFQMYHHWNLIGWYPQVRGGRCSVALLDSLALSSIGGGVCSCWRHKATVGFPARSTISSSATKLNSTHLCCYKPGYRFLQMVCVREKKLVHFRWHSTSQIPWIYIYIYIFIQLQNNRVICISLLSGLHSFHTKKVKIMRDLGFCLIA